MKLNLAVLTIALAFSLVACGGGKKKEAKKDAPKTEAKAGAQQKVVASPNGDLRVVDTAASMRKVREVVVGADGKLEVVEKEVPANNCNTCGAPRRSSCRTNRCR